MKALDVQSQRPRLSGSGPSLQMLSDDLIKAEPRIH